jgi:hypothetical protein
MKNENRKLELSGKFLQLGNSLIEEGGELEDYSITQSGTIMMLLSGVILSDEDMFLFSEICSMFSAKKVLDASEGVDDSEFVKQLMNSKLAEKKEKKSNTPRKPKGDNPDKIN